MNITEVAHDIQQQVSRYVTGSMGVVNSYDTWHGKMHQTSGSGLFMLILPFEGTKNVAKEMKKITDGLVRNRGVTWFPELVDKRK